MPDNSVTLRIGGQISLKKFARAIERFHVLVNGLTVVSRARGVEWIVSALSSGSAIATVEGLGDIERVVKVVDAFAEVGGALQRGDRLTYPKRVTKPAYDLRDFVGNG